MRFLWGQAWATISSGADTTRIEAGPDGTVDYSAALAQRYSDGITAENNAAIPLVRILGVDVLPEISERVALMKGHTQKQAFPGTFVSLEDYMHTHRPRPESDTPRADDDLYSGDVRLTEYALTQTPWAPSDFPDVAAWLAENEPALNAAVEASTLPRLYFGITRWKNRPVLLASYVQVSTWHVRGLADALLTRAMRRLASNDADSAWDDVAAVRRLARLVGQGPTLFDRRFANTLEFMALRATLAAAQSPALTPARAARWVKDLQTIQDVPGCEEPLEFLERYCWLDLFISCAQRGQMETRRIIFEDYRTVVPHHTSLDAINIFPVHYNALLRQINGIFDRACAAERMPTYSGRKAARQSVLADVQKAWPFPAWEPLLCVLPLDRRVLSLNPLLDYASDAERREITLALRDMATLTVALAGYHAEHGRYPPDLAALVPAYMAAVPADHFADAPLAYRLEGEDFLLYSRGLNGVDDGGIPATDFDSPTDDLVVRGTRLMPWFTGSASIRIDGFQ